MKKIAIIGGGAAGFFSAITCARLHPEYEVVIFEGTRRPLNKVKISGGGRCNVTHHCFEPSDLVKNYPRGFKELRGPFTRFNPKNTVEWFAKEGVELKSESDGRMFPITNNSQAIIDCLQKSAENSGVKIKLGVIVKSIQKNSTDNNFEITLRTSEETKVEKFHKVILASGSSPSGFEFAKSLGHNIVSPVPSLFTFNVEDKRIDGLAGVSFPRATLRLEIKSPSGEANCYNQEGPLLITHWGLSGPGVLKLSAWAARDLFDAQYHGILKINFLQGESKETIFSTLAEYKNRNSKTKISKDSPFQIPKRFWAQLLKSLNRNEDLIWAHGTKDLFMKIASELVEGLYQVVGKGIFKEEFVTCGGVDLKEVNFSTMESKLCPGLFFAGEILNIDGVTGGFNFQNAWTTGWIAGQTFGILKSNPITDQELEELRKEWDRDP